MRPINIIDVINNRDWRKAVLSIKGKAALRLHNILLIKFNDYGRYCNKVKCNVQELTNLMGYRYPKEFRKARIELASIGLWQYHMAYSFDQKGRKAGYFSLPTKFLGKNKMDPSIKSDESISQSTLKNSRPSTFNSDCVHLDQSEKPELCKRKVVKGENKKQEDRTTKTSYNLLNNLESYINIDVDTRVKLIVKTLLQKGVNLKYYSDSPNLRTIFQKQLSELNELVCQPRVNTEIIKKIIRKILNQKIKQDALNYLICCLRNLISTAKISRKIPQTYSKKYIEIGTDWSKKKAEVYKKANRYQIKRFFLNLEKETGLNKQINS